MSVHNLRASLARLREYVYAPTAIDLDAADALTTARADSYRDVILWLDGKA